jgi:hypothetical protein
LVATQLRKPILGMDPLASYLRDWASKINMDKIKKAPPRKPTKNKTERIQDKSPHVSTARLLEEAKKNQSSKTKAQMQV